MESNLSATSMFLEGVEAGGVHPAMLQTNLDKTLKYAQQMKGDYGVIKQAYHALKQQYGELTAAFKQSKQQCDAAFMAKSAVEKECEQLYKQWNEHLKQQQDQFADIQSQMVPSRELEMLRVQMVEELELPHRQRVEALSEEIAKYRDLYFKEHRSLALLNTQAEQQAVEHGKALQEEQETRRVAVEELQHKNRGLQELVEDKAQQERLRGLERENAELHLRHKQAAEEMSALRDEKDQLLVAVEEVHLQSSTALSQEKGRSTVLEKERGAYAQRCQELVGELHAGREEEAMLRARVSVLEDQARATQQKVEQQQRALRHAQEDARERFAQAQDEWQAQLDRLQSLLDASQKQLCECRERQEAMAEEREAEAREAARRLKQVADAGQHKLLESEKEREALAFRLDDLNRSMREMDGDFQEQADGMRQRLEETDAHLQCLSQERDAAVGRMEGASDAAGQYREELEAQASSYRELETEYELLQEKHRDLLQRDHDSAAERSSLEAELALLRDDNHALASEARETHAKGLAALHEHQEQWAKERRGLREHVGQLTTSHSREEADTKVCVDKLKAEKKKYKKMSQHLRDRVSQLMREVAAGKKEQASLGAAKQTELDSLSQRLQEAERQRDDLKMRLTSKFASLAVSAGMPALYTPSFLAGTSSVAVSTGPSHSTTG